MNRGELLAMLTNRAKEYRLVANESILMNWHMNEGSGVDVPQEDIDALLVDFINYVARSQCIDLGLRTRDLVEVENYEI